MRAMIVIGCITLAVIIVGWSNPKFDRIEQDGYVKVIMWYTPLFKTNRKWVVVHRKPIS